MDVGNILIINQPIGNRGDEAAHRALVRSLNVALPDVNVTVLSFMDSLNGISEFIVDFPKNEYVRFIFPHNYMADPCTKFLVQQNAVSCGTSIHPILRRLISYYKKADVVLCAPGGICMGGFQNWRHLYFLQLAKIFHKPLVYYSRSIGPFPTGTRLNRKFKEISLNLLHTFDFLSLRDSKSKKYADDWGVKYISAIDTAFLEKPHVDLPTEVKCKLAEKYVIVVPNKLSWHYLYSKLPQTVIDNFWIAVVDKLRQSYTDHQIVMLPQLCSIGKRGDYNYFIKLKEMMPQTDIYVVPDIYGSDIQQTIISGAKMVVGARYHSVVFAINNEVPFIALGYEHKIAGLLEELNLSTLLLDITKTFIDETTINQTLSAFAEKLDELNGEGMYKRPRRDEAYIIATKCFNSLIKYIKSL